ncbi:sugar-binding transcriptional regulator [Enterococcus sp. AZ196]|uniref:sugar-binding transcriptional regulator n=1 Tax=Enterococcus sp. AZ196 TaxID=2774659 RepID=UPI003D2D225C
MNTFEEKNIIKIACLYYEDGLTQAQIAKIIGVSRSLVSKLLLDAREQGIVEITINSKNEYTSKLERSLEAVYGLKTAMVVDSKDLTNEEVEKVAANYGAYYLNSRLKSIKKLGISWGKGIRRVVDSVIHSSNTEVAVIPLIGGMGDSHVNIHSNQLCYDLARKIRGQSKYLYAPAMLSDEQLAIALRSNQTIKSVLDDGANVDFAIVGLGNPYAGSTMEEIGYLTEADIQQLKTDEALGDINSNFFDARGEKVDNEINKSIVGITLEDIRKIPQVMTIVDDLRRMPIAKIAIETKLINILVTTDKVAQALLEEVAE